MGKLTALLSVYNKDGIVEFARELAGLGFNHLSSGGTAATLREAGVAVRDVAELVGGGAILGHRVVTLSREIHAGLLARDTPEDRNEIEKLGIPRIDLVCVDFYPLRKAIALDGATLETVIEATDIGGPTMVRSAAKGRRIVVCDPDDRMRVIEWLKRGKPDEDAFITELCAKAEAIVARYCLASARYHGNGNFNGMIGAKSLSCKYGENAWQTPAGLSSIGSDDPLALDTFRVVAGTPPSYNNLCDVDRMLQTATHIAAAFKVPTVIGVAVKHGNPCGASISFVEPGADGCAPRRAVIQGMVEGDTRAIFGGLCMVNFTIDEELADILLTHASKGVRRLLDGIVAPWFTPGAIDALKRKGDKCRFIENPSLAVMDQDSLDTHPRFRYVRGGFLSQPNYAFVPDFDAMDLAEHRLDARLAWAIGSTSNSNTITLVKGHMLIGNGVGQQDRVGCCELALKRARDAGHDPKGALAYSDSFFPFPDGPQVLIDAGIDAIFATSGSVNDDKTRAVCEKAGVRLHLLPDAEARGFYGH